jgi:hypothetical protein
MCDWLPQMRLDAAHVRPQAIVVEFSGNAITPCMRALDGAPLTGAAYFEAYAAAARSVLRTFAPDGTLVFFAGSPVTRQQVLTHSSLNRQLNALYQRIAATSPDAGYVDAGAAVLADGQWTHTLPCLPEEPCTGTDQSGDPADVVRSPDGTHFCPVAPPADDGVIKACRVWSSGAYRFGTAMAAPVAGALSARVSGATTVLAGRLAGRQ